MDSIPDIFWFLLGVGGLVFGTFAGLALIFRATRDRIQFTVREEEEE
jgi:ABC-type phosphate/phosphonate transport system permease subunit